MNQRRRSPPQQQTQQLSPHRRPAKPTVNELHVRNNLLCGKRICHPLSKVLRGHVSTNLQYITITFLGLIQSKAHWAFCLIQGRVSMALNSLSLENERIYAATRSVNVYKMFIPSLLQIQQSTQTHFWTGSAIKVSISRLYISEWMFSIAIWNP